MPAHATIVAIGEVLWDMFPEGPQFGGAPANFACSVAGLAGEDVEVCVLSAVGRDELGQRALDILHDRGVDTSYVSQIDHPTGQVLVHLDAAGHASYEFASDNAWDYIPWTDELLPLASRADVVCFGTLAQRSGTSRSTIQSFLQATRADCLRILDINLRPPFWSNEVVQQSLELANILKLNDHELRVVAQIMDLKIPDHQIVEQLLRDFRLKLVALTYGAKGAIIRSLDEHSDLPSENIEVVNTVGAGDAYTAALAIGMLRGLPVAQTNAWANRVAAFVCTQPGAAPNLPDSLRVNA
jgi:fructokinase